MTPRVLVNEKIAAPGVALLRERFDVVELPGWSAEQLAEEIGAFDGILIRSATKLTAELIDRASKMKVIGRAGVGVDNVDLDAATRRGIIVANAPMSTVESVAEHTLGLLFALARNIPQGDATLKAGEWQRSKLGGIELAGKTLVLLGVGRIGQSVADKARALGMRVVGYDPFVAADRFARMGIEQADSIDAALAQAELLSLHMPLTPETRNLLGADALATLPAGARIVNAARGALVDLDALDAAMESGHVAGAGLDVFPSEPPSHHPLFDRPNVVLTPHLAASTGEAQDRAGIAVAEQVSAALTGGVVTTAVNIPAMRAEDVEALQPFAGVAARLARLAHAAVGGGAASLLKVESRGDIAAFDVRMLVDNALVGMLSGTSDEPVTFVNARTIAAARGLEVAESTDPAARGYTSLLHVAVTGDAGPLAEAALVGTTIGRDDRPWLVEALGFDVDIELAGHMALFRYADVPGMIGRVGTAFGEAGMNIANMAVARRDGKALMAVTFDEAPPRELIERIGASEAFDFACAVAL